MQYLGLAGDRLMIDLTLIAEAENSQTVMRWLKFEFARNFVLLVFDNLTIKFNQLTALGANQMIVVLVIIAMFVARITVGKAFLTSQSAFR